MNAELEAILKTLDNRAERSPLLPKRPHNRELEAQIEALDWKGNSNETAVVALMAALHLRNDSLDLSHSYAQEIEHDATGAYWHGIMHRMEGDFSNSKYWFRMAGHHPAMERTRLLVADWLGGDAETAASIADPYARGVLYSFRSEAGWEPSQFVNLIVWQERQAKSDAARPVLENIQRLEIQSLFEMTLEAARPYLEE